MYKTSTRKNFILYYLYQASILLSTFIITPYISKTLGSENLGIYSFTFSIANLLYVIAELGTSTYAVKVIAINKDNKLNLSKAFLEIELMTVYTTVICVLIYIIFSSFQTKYFIYFILWLFFLISAAFDITWFYAGIERFDEIFIKNIILRVLGVISVFLFVKNKNSLSIYIVIHSCMYLVPFALMWTSLPKYISIKNVQVSITNIVNHLKESFVYFIPTIASSLYMIIDKSMLGFMIDDKRESGYYEMASEVMIFGKTLTAIVISHIFQPKASYSYNIGDKESIKKFIYLSSDFTLFLSIGMIFGIFSVSHIFVPVFFGLDFLPVEFLLKIMSPLLIITSIAYILEYEYLMPASKGKNINIYVGLGAIINIILNLFFIYYMRSTGAVIASIITETFILVCFFINSDNIVNLYKIIKLSFKKIISGIIMSLIILLFNNIAKLIGLNNQIILLIADILIGIFMYVLSEIILRDNIINFYKEINDQ